MVQSRDRYNDIIFPFLEYDKWSWREQTYGRYSDLKNFVHGFSWLNSVHALFNSCLEFVCDL